MKVLKIIFWTLWRLWFYILVTVPIIIMFPFLFLTILSEKTYRSFLCWRESGRESFCTGWASIMKWRRTTNWKNTRVICWVANHTSMMDVMLMLLLVKDNPFVFVGKKELVKLPIFGFFYKRTCILVDRSSSKSRFAVFERAQRRINQGLSICIFPEGGVPEDESIMLDEFKDGAFRIAIEHQLPILPHDIWGCEEAFFVYVFQRKPWENAYQNSQTCRNSGEITGA